MYRLFLAQRYLKSRLVNLIAVGGVMFGVAVLIVVTSVMDGFRAKVLTVLRGSLSDIVLVPMIPDGEALPAYELVDARLREDPRVRATSPELTRQIFYLYPATGSRGLVVEGHAIQDMTAVGIDFDREREVSDIEEFLIASNDPAQPFFSERALDRVIDGKPTGTVLVSRTFAEKFLGLGQHFADARDLLDVPLQLTFLDIGAVAAPADGPGATQGRAAGPEASGDPDGGDAPPPEAPPPAVRVRSITAAAPTITFIISGVYDAEDTSLDLGRVFMERGRLADVAHIDDPYHSIRVKLKDHRDAAQVKQDFTKQYPDFQTTIWQDHRRQYLRAVNNEKVLLLIVLSFIVLLGGFIILATLTLTVVEKTKDIGVLAALGSTRRGILSLFVGTALLIGVMGSLLGVGLGWLFTSNVNAIKDFLAERMGVQIFPADIYLFREIPTIWDWPAIAWIVGGSILMSLVAGLIPALRAARMDPVRALRYE